MKIYDISQEVFGGAVYPGDPTPKRETVCTPITGGCCNITEFSMCAHNGTHIDAPYHFFADGKTVDQIPIAKTVGYAYVYEFNGDITAADAFELLKTAESANPDSAKRILIKGGATVTAEAARVFAENEVFLVGNESQTVGPEDAPAEVHRILLGADTVLLEGVRLVGVPEGVYILFAAPINLAGCDGAPCRALLMQP